MPSHAAIPGIALWCDLNGNVMRIVRNDSDLLTDLDIGNSLSQIVDADSHAKMQNFLQFVQEHGAAFDWELNVRDGDHVGSLHFAAVQFSEQELLIILARTSNGVMQLFDEMMRMNNEQANQLRQVIKEQSEAARARTEHDSTLYNQLSRLNNELATLQRQLTQKNAQLERLNQLKNQFLGMAAHDLRTPLNIIMAYSEFLLMEAGDRLSSEHQEFLNIIGQSSDFMLSLINDLLDIAVIESGQLTLSPKSTDIIALVQNNVELNNVLAGAKNIHITFDTDIDLLTVRVDPERIAQVLNNLLNNAIKFSDAGSNILVRITHTDDEIRLIVQDHGRGMSAEQISTLFEGYIGTSERGTAGEKGTGLGLAIVKRIVTEHQGTIMVDSAVGTGTKFIIKLPTKNSER